MIFFFVVDILFFLGLHFLRLLSFSVIIIKSFLYKITHGSGNSTYHDFLDCTWLFQVASLSDPPPTISFEFVDFDVEWRFDKVSVYDGADTNSPIIFSYTATVDTSTTPLEGRTSGTVPLSAAFFTFRRKRTKL